MSTEKSFKEWVVEIAAQMEAQGFVKTSDSISGTLRFEGEAGAPYMLIEHWRAKPDGTYILIDANTFDVT
jgi:hypothetical protein